MYLRKDVFKSSEPNVLCCQTQTCKAATTLFLSLFIFSFFTVIAILTLGTVVNGM
jgi:hypothetical protein